MSRYRLELATADDDPDLRHILAATSMPGAIRLALAREPSYSQGAQVEGAFRQVIAARDTHTGRVVGFGVRSVDVRYVNGQPRPIGYLSQLRLLREHRQRGLVARGYGLLRELHSDGRTPVYLTTIAGDNRPALDLLTSGRAGLPCYQLAGDFHTFVLPIVDRRRAASLPHDIELSVAESSDSRDVFAFVARCGAARQWFPCYDNDAILFGIGRLQNLNWQHVWLARRRGTLIGMLAGWDQRATRQIIVQGYSQPLSLLRPVYNLWAGATNQPLLPRVGESLPALTLALPLIDDSEPSLLAALVECVTRQQAASGAKLLLLGLHDSDPLLPSVLGWTARRYTSRLFYVYWPDGANTILGLDGRPTYLELGSL